jgi:hypothetical protein
MHSRARTVAAWTATGIAHPPELVTLLHQHLDTYRTTPDGRLFRRTRGGILSESGYGRAWHAARDAALGPAWL